MNLSGKKKKKRDGLVVDDRILILVQKRKIDKIYFCMNPVSGTKKKIISY